MNPHPLFTPIYLLSNHHAAHALCVFTGVSNSVEHKQPQHRYTQLSNQLINNFGYGEILKTYSIQNSLHIRFIEHHASWFSFDILPLLRSENKEKVYDLITRLNEDEKISFDHARYLSGLYGPTELLTDGVPKYEKLTKTKEEITLDEQAVVNAAHLKNNPFHFDELIPDNLYCPDSQNTNVVPENPNNNNKDITNE